MDTQRASFSERDLQTPDLPYPFLLHHLTELPTSLAVTDLAVRPCVAFLQATSPIDRQGNPVDVETALIPKLDAKEVAAVFSAPFHNFLKCVDENIENNRPECPGEQSDTEMADLQFKTAERTPRRRQGKRKMGDENQWYKGTWTTFHESPWRMHNFHVPVKGRVVSRPRCFPSPSSSPPASSAPYPKEKSGTTLPYRDQPHLTKDPLDEMDRFKVFGMTARILVDCARVAYAEEPDFEHNEHFGDEDLIRSLIEMGKLELLKGAEDNFEPEDRQNSHGGKL